MAAIFRLFLEGTLQFLISATMNIYDPRTELIGELFSLIVSVFTLVSIIGIAILHPIILIENRDSLSKIKFKKYYGSTYDEIKTNHVLPLFFYAVFLIRRIVFVALIFYC